jgi:uncharacterized protein with NRDE domain
MCLIVFAWQMHPDFPLVLGANRDEFLDRPTRPAAFWSDCPDLLAGRDLRGGGTWLGVTRAGRIAAVTNFRQGTAQATGARSRGLLVSDALTADRRPDAHLDAVAAERDRYEGFNLLLAVGNTLHYYSNRDGAPARVEPGLHGLSNALLDTPWPKVARARTALAGLLDCNRDSLLEGMLALLADQARPADDELPDTGVSLAWERCLSPVFITSPDYGTRSSTVLLVDRHGRVSFLERSFDHATGNTSDAIYDFTTR